MQEGQPEAEQQTELAARASTRDGKHSHPELIIDTGITTSVTVGRRPMCEVAATFTALIQMVTAPLLQSRFAAPPMYIF